MPFGTGHNAQISFAEQGVAYAIRQMDGMEWSGPSADVSHLSTATYRKKLPVDLFDHGPFNLQFVFNTGLDLPRLENRRQTIILTMPRGPTESAAANYTGPGWLSGFRTPNLLSNQENVGQMSVQWEEFPIYTKAVVKAEAIALVPSVADTGSAAVLDASRSLGSTLIYQWSILSAPEGSTATLTTPTAVQAGITPDVVGAYTFLLSVTGGNITDTTRAEMLAVAP